MSLPTRDEVPADEKWDPSLVFDSPDDWASAADAFEARLDDLRAYEGRAAEDGETLLELLDLVEELKVRRLGRLHLYAFLTSYVDTTDTAARERFARYRDLAAEMASAMGSLVPELREAGREHVEELRASTPGLDRHGAHLDRLLSSADHALSRETESVLAELDPALESGSDVGRSIVDGDVAPPTVETTDGERRVTPAAKSALLRARDREVRRVTHERFREELRRHRHGMASAYVGRIRADCRRADVRDYDSALARRLAGRDASLGGTYPTDAYETVIEGIADRLGPHHDLLEARREATDGDQFREWDLLAPLPPGEAPEVPYDRARELILDSLSPLGEAYVDRVAGILDERRVDVRETANKRRGPKAIQNTAVAEGPFLALNYDGSLRALLLFTHELGHAANRELAADEQWPIDQGVPEHTGEVASFAHETLLVDHLAEVWSGAEALHARSVFLDKLPLYRAARGATFVHELHDAVADGADPGPDALDERHRDLLSEFKAPVELGEHAGAGWQEIDLAREPYHAYLYATGSVGALALVRALREGDLAPEQYREMLARGRSVRSNEAFRPTLDFTDEATVERGIDAYADRVDALLDAL
ncbi:M3 family oligoendopeptidase [Halolamina sediminis]|uniref:M3 family oligoendopeptidase n=1 Tax=Halolamina sediminis TaxID=1480675 RepID=UPI0006B4DEF9|nr:M3 family metallopeptidase [Halolamina sediminis]